MLGIYTIYDKVAKECGPLFNAKNDDVAIRMYNNSPEFKNVNKNDFALYRVGTFDTEMVDKKCTLLGHDAIYIDTNKVVENE